MNFIPLDVSLDEACLEQLVRRYHFKDKDKRDIERLYRLVSPRVHPQFHYVTDSDAGQAAEKFLGGDLTSALVVLTLGPAFDSLQNALLEKGEIGDAYIVDCLGLEILSRAYEKLDEKLFELTGLYPGDYVFAGDERLPLEKVPELMGMLAQPLVSYNEAFLLIPKKSVLFMAPLYGKPVAKHSHCKLCGAVSCPMKAE
ncbi:MAG: hypothetical protein K6G10_11220 [Butyrivibrio sp.]|nr:hypothetical protein [Butyrivibrio sp.]